MHCAEQNTTIKQTWLAPIPSNLLKFGHDGQVSVALSVLMLSFQACVLQNKMRVRAESECWGCEHRLTLERDNKTKQKC